MEVMLEEQIQLKKSMSPTLPVELSLEVNPCLM
jgi:hypothetical protein